MPKGDITLSDGERSERTHADPPFWSDVRVMRTKALAAHIWAVGAPRPKGILDGILGGIPGDRTSAWDLRSGAAANPGISCRA
jgi:hypothetical protein